MGVLADLRDDGQWIGAGTVPGLVARVSEKTGFSAEPGDDEDTDIGRMPAVRFTDLESEARNLRFLEHVGDAGRLPPAGVQQKEQDRHDHRDCERAPG